MTVNFRWKISLEDKEPFYLWYFPAAMARAEKEAEEHPGKAIRVHDNDTGILLAIWRADGTRDSWRRCWPKKWA